MKAHQAGHTSGQARAWRAGAWARLALAVGVVWLLPATARAQAMVVDSLLLAGSPVAQVAQVQLRSAGAATFQVGSLATGTRLPPGTEVQLPAQVEVTLRSDPAGVVASFSPGARFKVQSVQERGQVHELLSGLMKVAVQRPLDFFNVQFDQFVALVRGTEFELSVGDGAPRARLDSGALRVEAPQRARVGDTLASDGMARIDALDPRTQPAWQAEAREDEPRFADAGAARLHYARRVAQAQRDGEPDTLLAAYNNLGRLLVDLSQAPQAQPWFQQGLALARERGDLPWLARMQNNLGVAALAQGRAAVAETWLRQALDLNRRLYADGVSLRIAGNLNNLGLALRAQGRLDEAEQAYEQALQVHQRLAVPARRGTQAGSLQNLGNLLVGPSNQPALCGAAADPAQRARAERGRALLQQALALNQQGAAAEGDLDVARNLLNLGLAELRLCDPTAAEPLLRQALQLRLQRYPDGLHASVPAAYRALAEALWRQGRADDAGALRRRALALQRQLDGAR